WNHDTGHAEALATIGRDGERGSLNPGVLALGPARLPEPGHVDVSAGADRDVGPLVVADRAADLHGGAERGAAVGRPRDVDLVAAVRAQVGPGPVDGAAHSRARPVD